MGAFRLTRGQVKTDRYGFFVTSERRMLGVPLEVSFSKSCTACTIVFSPLFLALYIDSARLGAIRWLTFFEIVTSSLRGMRWCK